MGTTEIGIMLRPVLLRPFVLSARNENYKVMPPFPFVVTFLIYVDFDVFMDVINLRTSCPQKSHTYLNKPFLKKAPS